MIIKYVKLYDKDIKKWLRMIGQKEYLRMMMRKYGSRKIKEELINAIRTHSR